MAHRDMVSALALKYDIDNPLRDDQLRVEAVEFLDEAGERLDLIEGTPQNRASRLWVQDKALEIDITFPMTDQIREDVRKYFAERWDGDWSITYRKMMFWLATAPFVRAHFSR